MARQLLISVALIMILTSGCKDKGIEPSARGADLEVKNSTSTDIFPAISYGQIGESFGIVTGTSSKVVGFGPFKLGDKVVIKWGEGQIEPKKEIELDTFKYLKIKDKISRIQFNYVGDGKWKINAFDENRKKIDSGKEK